MLIFPKCWCQIDCYKHASNMPNVLIPNICLYELNSNYLHLTLKCFSWLRYGPCIFLHCPLLSKHYLLPNTHFIITLKTKSMPIKSRTEFSKFDVFNKSNLYTMNIGSFIETSIAYWTAINMSLGWGKYSFMLNWRRHLNLWNKIPFLFSCMANKNIEYSIMCINDLLCLCYLRTFGKENLYLTINLTYGRYWFLSLCNRAVRKSKREPFCFTDLLIDLKRGPINKEKYIWQNTILHVRSIGFSFDISLLQYSFIR